MSVVGGRQLDGGSDLQLQCELKHSDLPKVPSLQIIVPWGYPHKRPLCPSEQPSYGEHRLFCYLKDTIKE